MPSQEREVAKNRRRWPDIAVRVPTLVGLGQKKGVRSVNLEDVSRPLLGVPSRHPVTIWPSFILCRSGAVDAWSQVSPILLCRGADVSQLRA